MIGLEYILGLYNMQHNELAEKLGIKKQNINLWIKGRQSIPKKYMPVLGELFGISSDYFGRELSEVDQLEIQKEKLKRDLNPVIKKHISQFVVGDHNNIAEVPVYDKEEMNTMERTIEKAKLISRFKAALEIVDDNPFLDTFKLIVELLEKAQHEVILHKTVEALSHYLQVLPDWINSEPDQEEFEKELFEILDDHNY